MQILGPDEGALPTIPETPALEHFLFEAPFVPTAILGVGAMIALSLAMRSEKRRGPLIGASLMLLLAIVVPVIASMVTTTREILSVRAEALIASVATADAQAMRDIMTDQVALGPSDNATSVAAKYIPRIRGEDQVVGAVERAKNRFYPPETFVGAHKVLETRAGMESENTGRTLVRVRVEGPSGEYLNHSWWDITWKRQGDEWLASQIEAIWIQG